MIVKMHCEQDIYLTDGASAGVKTVLEVGKLSRVEHLLRGTCAGPDLTRS